MKFWRSGGDMICNTGTEHIIPGVLTGVHRAFYRKQAYTFKATTGDRRTFYRSSPYIFRCKLLISQGFWKHKPLTLLLIKLKNITMLRGAIFSKDRGKRWN